MNDKITHAIIRLDGERSEEARARIKTQVESWLTNGGALVVSGPSDIYLMVDGKWVEATLASPDPRCPKCGGPSKQSTHLFFLANAIAVRCSKCGEMTIQASGEVTDGLGVVTRTDLGTITRGA